MPGSPHFVSRYSFSSAEARRQSSHMSAVHLTFALSGTSAVRRCIGRTWFAIASDMMRSSCAPASASGRKSSLRTNVSISSSVRASWISSSEPRTAVTSSAIIRFRFFAVVRKPYDLRSRPVYVSSVSRT